MRDRTAVAVGTGVTFVVGVVGAIVPALGAMFAAICGGIAAGTLGSRDDPIFLGTYAGFLGGVIPSYVTGLGFIYRSAIDPVALTPARVFRDALSLTPYVMVLAAILAVCGALGGATVRLWPGITDR